MRTSGLAPLIVAFALLAGCSERTATSDATALPSVSSLPHEWTRLEPGGETACSDGSAYSFFVRPAASDKLLVYFQGGGACASGENCSRFVNPTYKPAVAADEQPRAGIFDFSNAGNPFLDYDIVVIPYCTGDVHIGDAVVTYDVPATDSTPAGPLQVHHRGYANARAVLDWVFANYSAPSTVFVTGSSAGSIAAPFYAAIIAGEYDDARVVELGDASGAYRASGMDSTLIRWGTPGVLTKYSDFRDLAIDSLTMQNLYVAAAAHHPELRMAQYDAAGDEIQAQFVRLGMGDEAFDVSALIGATHSDLRQQVAGYRSYMAGGPDHTVLAAPWFYTFLTDGWRVRDWVAALAAGEDVPDVRCDDCSEAGLWFTADDRRILELADSLLSSAEHWQQRDDRVCTDDDEAQKWSLACAIRAGTSAIPGNPVLAGVDRLRATITHQAPALRRAQLIAFNNQPGVRFADIKRVLALTIASVDSALEAQAAAAR